MKCPACGAQETRVIDSRNSRDGFTIRRRRHCSGCANRFTTYEQIGENCVMVIKKDSSRVPFDRAKIYAGLEKACYKRPIEAVVIDELISKIETALTRTGDMEVASSKIGEMVMESLRDIDQVAYVRFASVYRDFKDVNDFEQEIRPMLSGSSK